jgi:hypothetical protein
MAKPKLPKYFWFDADGEGGFLIDDDDLEQLASDSDANEMSPPYVIKTAGLTVFTPVVTTNVTLKEVK